MKTRTIIAWILQALLAVAFVKSGYSKLADLGGTGRMFGGMGLPIWFGGLIGAAELLGGIGLLVSRTVRLAALGLMIVMIGALVMHATKIPGGIGGGSFAAIMLVLLAVVYFLRRPEPTTLSNRMTA